MKETRRIITGVLLLCLIFSSGSVLQIRGATNDTYEKSLETVSSEEDVSDEDVLEEDVLDGDYISFDEDTVEQALADNTDEDVVQYISSIGEMYGDEISESTLINAAKIQIATNTSVEFTDFSNIDSVQVGSKVELFDANDRNSCVGYNFTTTTNEFGYIILSKHTKAPLIRELKLGSKLPTNNRKLYFFSEGEIYVEDEQCIETLDGSVIDVEEF